MHHAAFTGNELFVIYTDAFKADIEATDNEGKTPLHLCVKSFAEHRNIECIKKLLLAGANRNAVDSYNLKPIDYINSIKGTVVDNGVK